jgi:glutamate racemase
MLEGWLSPMSKAGVDTIVLGCTHYPLAGEAIRRVMRSSVHLIETGDAIAKRLQFQLKLEQNSIEATVAIYATGEIDREAAIAILGIGSSVEAIKLKDSDG